jgi:hypothetical protein
MPSDQFTDQLYTDAKEGQVPPELPIEVGASGLELEYDIVVYLPPKREYHVELEIISISKAKPNIAF